MKLKGKYYISSNDTVPCEIEIKKGKLEVFGDKARQPKERKIFEVKKTEDESGLIQTTNYFIRYVNNADNEQIIYVNINAIKLSLIKYQRRELFFQKMTLIERLFSIIAIILLNVLSSYIYDSINNTQSKNNLKATVPTTTNTQQSMSPQKSHEDTTTHYNSNKSSQLDSLNIIF